MALEVRRRLHELSRERYVPPWELALVEIALGERERAFAELERAFDDAYWRMLYLRVDPKLDTLRDDPRFEALVGRLGF